MANGEHLAILRQGVEVWNRWTRNNKEIKPDLSRAFLTNEDLNGVDLWDADLSEASLSRSNLHRANLIRANLLGAHLSNANLSGATLIRANLLGVDFWEADLGGANLSGADLSGANFWGADLRGANLSGANLCGAKLSGAVLWLTTFANTDLGGAIGIDRVVHKGPSSIGIDTILKSQGKIPDSFLRGAGVPEDFVRFLPSFFAQPFRFYSCFISHSSLDKLFCERLYADLHAKGVRVWYFPEDAKWGRTVWGEIDQSIKAYDKLVVVCSENSLKSGPVNREIERALQREDREGKHVLFPIRMDDYIFETWEHERKADVLAKVVGDFTNWQDPTSYKKAFDKLLAALQAEDKKKD